jgi:replication factor A1
VDNSEVQEYKKIGTLNTYSRGVNTIAKVIKINEVRNVVARNDNTKHRVTEALVSDDTGSIYLTLWDEAIDEVEPGIVLEIENGYVNVFRGSMRLNIGHYGSFQILHDAPFDEVDVDNNLSSNLVEDPRRRRYQRNR